MSASWALLLVGPAVVGGIIAFWLKSSDQADISIPPWLLWSGGVAVIFLGIQARAEYKRRTYDLSLIFKYDDRFNSLEVKRARAAKVLKDNQGKLSRCTPELACIDDVLDFFEELGFAERGGQITPEVIHQNFHYWIRGYYSAASEYIFAKRNNEKSVYEHLESLHDIVHEVSLTRNEGKAAKEISGAALREFLDHEIALDINSKEKSHD